MPSTVRALAPHPREALFAGERPFPIIPACEHYAGSERLIGEALELQAKLGRLFDVSCDCEDGAAAGKEQEHAEMIVDVLSSARNTFAMAGVRIHDPTHPSWKQDVDILVAGAGKTLAYLTLPKATTAAQVAEMIAYIRAAEARAGLKRPIPVHVLIETHGALHDAWPIAATPGVQCLA